MAFGWVHQAAHVLANAEQHAGAAVAAAYKELLATMTAGRDEVGALAPAIDHFRKVTASYWDGLFHCYDVPDLPCTNNDLEQAFGAVRYHERRASGRKGAAPGLVVRGAVRVVAALATRLRRFTAAELQPGSVQRWQALRSQLRHRQEVRRAQLRFRRKPDAYLAAIEAQALKLSLPS